MADRDLVMAKVATVDRWLARIDETTGGDPQRLEDVDVNDVFVLYLQRAVQACIDLAHHLTAGRPLGLPSTLADAFTLLERGAGLDSELATRMRSMVGFRNIAVHEYQALDPAILKAILTGHLDDLRAFCRYALEPE